MEWCKIARIDNKLKPFTVFFRTTIEINELWEDYHWIVIDNLQRKVCFHRPKFMERVQVIKDSHMILTKLSVCLFA